MWIPSQTAIAPTLTRRAQEPGANVGRFTERPVPAATSSLPSGSCAITAFGMPFSRISAVSARVSMPESPMTPRAFSQSLRFLVAR